MTKWIEHKKGDPVPDGPVRIRDKYGWESGCHGDDWSGWESGFITHYMKEDEEMKHEYKVGDWVIAKEGDFDITKGKAYEVIDLDGDNVKIINDVGGEWWLYMSEVTPATTPKPDTYVKILEALLGPDAVSIARKISEALK